MKLNKIFALMKQRKSISVVQGATAQWVGDGVCLYPIYNLPKLTESAMQMLLDISDDAWDKFTFKEYDCMSVSEEDFEERQIDLEPMKISLHWKGCDYIPLMGSGKVFYIQAKYLKPFADDTLLSYSYRDDKQGVIAVNEGLLLSGLICPAQINDPVFVETLYRLYELTKRQGEDIER